jgi:hypothetical protein
VATNESNAATFTVRSLTVAPAITTSPICEGTTSVSGTSEPGAAIIVYAGASQIGTGTASGTSWTVTVSPAFVAGNSITTTAQASGKCVSAASSPLTVTPLPTFTYTKSDPKCFGASDGTITITASGGSGTYEFSKDGGTTWTTPQSENEYTFSNLSISGNPYTIAVRDGSGCVQTNCDD